MGGLPVVRCEDERRCGMMVAIICAVIAIVTIFAEIGFIFAGNGFGAALCLVFGLLISGMFRFLSEIEGDSEGRSTNDVAPKSEVEELLTRLAHAYEKIDIAEDEVEALEIELKAMRSAANSYKMHYEKVKTEVAREIFEEMQSCLVQRHWNGLDIVTFEFDAVKYAKLKKKYTEEKT